MHVYNLGSHLGVRIGAVSIYCVQYVDRATRCVEVSGNLVVYDTYKFLTGLIPSDFEASGL